MARVFSCRGGLEPRVQGLLAAGCSSVGFAGKRSTRGWDKVNISQCFGVLMGSNLGKNLSCYAILKKVIIGACVRNDVHLTR